MRKTKAPTPRKIMRRVQFDPSWHDDVLDGDIYKTIKMLQSVADKLVKEHKATNIRLNTPISSVWDDYSIESTILYDRPETDDEYKRRCAGIAKARATRAKNAAIKAEKEEKKEMAEYKRLHRKFGDI